MPRITNPFQKLAVSITFATRGLNYSVEESVLNKNLRTGAIRELDILLTNRKNKNDQYFIECRDHTRVQNIQWVDSLYGKWKRLKYKKVIGISSSGFSKPALAEAKELGIELLTLKKAEDRNWQGLFSKLENLTIEQIHVPILAFIKLKNSSHSEKLTGKDLFTNEVLLFNKSLDKSRLLKQHILEIVNTVNFKDFIDNHIYLNKNTRCDYIETFGNGWFYQFKKSLPLDLETITLIVYGGKETVNFSLTGYTLGTENALIGDSYLNENKTRVNLIEKDSTLTVAIEQSK